MEKEEVARRVNEAKLKAREAGENMSDFDLAVGVTVQQIIQGEIQDAAQIEAILSGVSPEVRAEAIRELRTNDKLRLLFPEKAIIFDQHAF